MSRTIPWSRDHFPSNDVHMSHLDQHKFSSDTSDNEVFQPKVGEKTPNAADALRTPDEGLEATGDAETLVFDMATTAEDLELLGFVVKESAKEREIAYLYRTEIGRQRRAQKRNLEIDSEDGSTEQGDLATRKKVLLSTKDGDLATISETQISNKKVITNTGALGKTSLSNKGDHVIEDTTTSVETILSFNAEDFFSNPEDFLSNTEDLISNAEDLLSGMDDLTTSPEDFSPDMESCQLELVKEQCKVFDKLMEENRLLTQELMKLSTLPRTRETVEEISKGLKMITELSRRMRNCTASSLLNLTHVLLPDVS